MATIKDVASQAGVSATTVSIILNGKSETRKISKATQEKVWQAVRELNYHPNISARKLRSDESHKPTIAIYWSKDFETFLMSRFLRGLQDGVISQYQFDLVICPYEKDTLHAERGLKNTSMFHAAIIMSASEKDMVYLEENEPLIPIILFNRTSEKFSSVNIDNSASEQAALHFARKGIKNVALITADSSYYAMELRLRAFINACEEQKLILKREHIITAEHSIRGGVEAAEKLLAANPPPALFCDSDFLAAGVLYVCQKNGVRIPQDLEIITMAMTGRRSSEFTIPPLTIIDFPMEKMAAACLQIISDIIKLNASAPEHRYFETPLIIRASSPR